MKKTKLFWIVPLIGLTLAGCQAQSSTHHSSASTTQISQNLADDDANVSKQDPNNTDSQKDLASLNYQSGQSAVIQVNNGKSTLDPNSWSNDHVEYSQLDSLNRTSSPAIAYLDNQNVANDDLRTRQTVKPTGWHQKFDQNHQAILNRGHIIAYSLSKGINMQGDYQPGQQSGDQNNPRNLFTQTAFCNQELQTVYETKVRNALKQGKKVIYQVQPIFRGTELMPRGIHMQAISTNGSLNFNVYLFNVQPGYQFNYQTGTSTIDHAMHVPKLPNSPTFHN